MLKVFINSVDKTSVIATDSLGVLETLQSQSNTCSFQTNDFKPTEGQDLHVYHGGILQVATTAGSNKVLILHYDQSQFTAFRVGDVIIVGAKTANEETATVTVVGTTTITVNTLANTHAVGDLVGFKVFAGTIDKVKYNSIEHNTSYILYDIEGIEWTKKFNRKLVNDTFTDRSARYILVHILNNFVNYTNELDNMEYANAAAIQAEWIESQDGGNPTLDTTNEQEDDKCGDFPWTNTATNSATFSSTPTSRDLSDFTGVASGVPTKGVFCFWLKLASTTAQTTITFRLGNDASNYLSKAITPTATTDWQYIRSNLSTWTQTGTVTWNVIDYLAFIVAETVTSSLKLDGIRVNATGSFTFDNVAASTPILDDVRFSFKEATTAVETLAKIVGWFWYIDYEQDLHFFETSTTAAPFALTDSSNNYGSLSVSPDISQLANTVYVRGGTEPSATQVDTYKADGTQKIFFIKESPRTIGVNDNDQAIYDFALTVNAVSQTVGIIGVDSAASFQWMLNPAEKYIEPGTAATPTSGWLIEQTYTFEVPILVKAEDGPSIALMKTLVGGDGIFEVALENAKIKSTDQAFQYANAYLDKYANAIVTLEFETMTEGLQVGQLLTFTNADFGYSSEQFLIQQITKQQREYDFWSYRVTCASTLFGIIELFKMLLDKDLEIDAGQTVGLIQTASETITVTDSGSVTTDPDLVFKWGPDAHQGIWNFSQYS